MRRTTTLMVALAIGTLTLTGCGSGDHSNDSANSISNGGHPATAEPFPTDIPSGDASAPSYGTSSASTPSATCPPPTTDAGIACEIQESFEYNWRVDSPAQKASFCQDVKRLGGPGPYARKTMEKNGKIGRGVYGEYEVNALTNVAKHC